MQTCCKNILSIIQDIKLTLSASDSKPRKINVTSITAARRGSGAGSVATILSTQLKIWNSNKNY